MPAGGQGGQQGPVRSSPLAPVTTILARSPSRRRTGCGSPRRPPAPSSAISWRWRSSAAGQALVGQGQDPHGQEPGVPGPVHGHGGHRDPLGHLHHGQEGVEPPELAHGDGHADHRQRRHRRQHPGQVGGPAGAGDQDPPSVRRPPAGRSRGRRRVSGGRTGPAPRRAPRNRAGPRRRPPSPARRTRSPSPRPHSSPDLRSLFSPPAHGPARAFWLLDGEPFIRPPHGLRPRPPPSGARAGRGPTSRCRRVLSGTARTVLPGWAAA